MILPKAGLSPMAFAAIVLGMLSLALLAAVLVVWKRRSEAPVISPPALKVRARAEIVHSDGRRTVYEINAPLTRIGRAADNHIITDDDRVSSHHAEITSGRKGFSIRDLGSANGTFLCGERVTDSVLYAGDEIKIGSTRIVFGA